jgi:hypothetical protein
MAGIDLQLGADLDLASALRLDHPLKDVGGGCNGPQ